jgi:hypothetical protein
MNPPIDSSFRGRLSQIFRPPRARIHRKSKARHILKNLLLLTLQSPASPCYDPKMEVRHVHVMDAFLSSVLR